MKNLIRNTLVAACLGFGLGLFSPVKAHAQEFSLEAGLITDAALIALKDQTIYNNVLFQKVEAEIDILRYKDMSLFIGGNMSVFEVPQTTTLAPWVFYLDLGFNAGLRFGNLKIEYKHGSQHPATPYGTTLFKLPDGFQDSISATYTAKIPPIFSF